MANYEEQSDFLDVHRKVSSDFVLGHAGRRRSNGAARLPIPGDVAHDSGMMSPAIPR
jgi:hypothetical protein